MYVCMHACMCVCMYYVIMYFPNKQAENLGDAGAERLTAPRRWRPFLSQ